MSQPDKRIDQASVTVCAICCPLLKGGRGVRSIPWREGLTVRRAAEEAFPGLKASAWATKGSLTDGDSPVVPGAEYYAWNLPADPGTIATLWAIAKIVMVVAAVASAAYGAVMAYRSNREAKKLKKAVRNSDYSKEVEDVSDASYGWDFDASNAKGQGAPLPVLYGERLALPPLVQVHTRKVGSNQEYLELVAAVCQGGSGLADKVGVLADAAGEPDVRLNHSSWRNYILEAQYAADSSSTTNRLNTNTSVEESVYIDPDTGSLMAASNCDDLSNLFDYTNLASRPTANGKTTFLYTDIGSAYGVWNTPASLGLRNTGRKQNLSIFITLDAPTKLVELDALMVADRSLTFEVYGGTQAQGRDIRTYTFLAMASYIDNRPPGADLRQSIWKASCAGNNTFYRYLFLTCFRAPSSGSTSGGNAMYKLYAYGSVNQADSTDISQYADVETRPGAAVQAPLTLCTGVWNTLSVSKNLTVDWFVFPTSAGASPEKLELNLEFPYGIYDASGNDMLPYTVRIDIQRRWVDADGTAGEWEGFGGTQTRVVTEQSTSAYGVTYSETLPESHDHWEIRMRYNQALSSNPNICGDCVWNTLVEGYDFSPSYPGTCVAAVRMLATDALSGAVPQVKVRASRPLVCVWDGAEWVARPATNPAWAACDVICQPRFPHDGNVWQADADGSVYWLEPVSTTGVLSFASDAGGTLVTTGYRDGSDVAHTQAHGLAAGDSVMFANSDLFAADSVWEVASVPSASTFVVARAYSAEDRRGRTVSKVVRSDCAYGAGDAECAVDPRYLDFASFARWAEHCDEDGISMSAYFDGTTSAADALQYICDIGRAAIVRRGQVYAALYDGLPDAVTMAGEPVPAFAFTDDNIEAGTYGVGYASRESTPGEVQVYYFDRERENSRAAVIRFSGDASLHRNVQDITLYCCDDRRVAEEYADYVLKTSMARRSFSWTSDAASMPLDVGDLVSVKGNYAVITAASFDSQMRRQFEAAEYVLSRFVGSYTFYADRDLQGNPFVSFSVKGTPWPSDDPKTVLAVWIDQSEPCPRVDGETWPDSDFWALIEDAEGNVPDRILPNTAYKATYKNVYGLWPSAKGYYRPLRG